MSAIMISIRPEWCEKIASGKKTVEVRKTRPKIDPPFKCYIYCTLPKQILHAVYTKQDYRGYFADEDYDKIPENYKTFVKVLDGSSLFCCPPYSGNVIGEFVCDFFDDFTPTDKGVIIKRFSSLRDTALSLQEICGYLNSKPGFGWHISDLKIYDRPKAITEFLIIDKKAVKNCPYRERTGQAEIVTKHNGWIKGSYLCKIDGITWCYPCHTKNIERPPQSWCYIMEV